VSFVSIANQYTEAHFFCIFPPHPNYLFMSVVPGKPFVLLVTLLALAPIGSAQMRRVYVDDNPDNELYKLSFYSPSQGFAAFRDWIGFTADSGHTFTHKPITLSNVDYNG
jgi:hypothetical protein